MRAKVAALCLSAVALAGCATLTGDASPGLSGLGNGDVAIRAGDAVVTVDELDAEVQSAVDSGALEAEQFTGSELERRVQLQTLVLNNLFGLELATRVAADEFGIDVDEAAVDAAMDDAVEQAGGEAALEEQLVATGQSMETFRRAQYVNLLREAITEALLEQEPLTDEDVRAEYEARRGEFEQASVSHILVETEAEAQQVLARLEDGESFEDLARELSLDPGSSEAGGSLGLAPRGAYVPEFEAAIWDGPAPVGEVLGPIQTQFGFHVLRVDEFQVLSEDEAVEQVREQLQSTRGEDLFGFWFRQVRADADVEVAGRLGRWDRQAQAVVNDVVDSGAPTP